MKLPSLAIGLSGANLVLLAGLLANALPVTAQAPTGILRGSGLEIVDGSGRLRATISIQPESTANGQVFTETVLFRLINADGQPSLKLAASATGAGLSFVGGDDLSYVVLGADGENTMLRLTEPGGAETVIAP